jgi:hypothetical protein
MWCAPHHQSPSAAPAAAASTTAAPPTIDHSSSVASATTAAVEARPITSPGRLAAAVAVVGTMNCSEKLSGRVTKAI